jgi:hypothetical protein
MVTPLRAMTACTAVPRTRDNRVAMRKRLMGLIRASERLAARSGGVAATSRATSTVLVEFEDA